MKNPELPPQDSHKGQLLLAFDLLHARIAQSPAPASMPDAQLQMYQAVQALLTRVLETEQPSSKDSKNTNNSNIPPEGQRHLEQAHLLLEADGNIESFTKSVPDALGYPTIRLARQPFSTLLDEASGSSWEGLLAALQGRICIHTVTALTLLSLQRQPVPAICTVSKLLNSDRLHVSCLFVIRHLPPGMASREPQVSMRNDATLMRQLHALILQHLDRPLPTVAQLARQLGTNTFALKDGFKHYFNTGIYQFYNQERLARAKAMLVETVLPLPEIAEKCGFGSAATFSKAFKKKYGIAPLPFRKAQQDP